MAFTFRPATREHAKLLIGLCGSSGSGKTLSALKLATGIGGTIAYIDTEGGRACQYADDYQFLHATLEPDFHPDRYREIVDDAIKTDPNVIIIDSASHVWEGPGGILDMVDKARQTTKNDFGIWAAPKQAHQKFINRLIQVPAHVILCFRAKEKRGLVPDPRRPGKQEVVNLGWHPIAESGVVYELTINCLLGTDKKGVPVVDGFDFGKLPYNMASLLPPNEQISEETGRRFAAWTKSTGPGKRQAAAPPDTLPPHDPATGEVTDDGTMTVRLPPDSTIGVATLEEASKELAAAIRQNDVSWFESEQIIGANITLIGRMPEKWQAALKALSDGKREGAKAEGNRLSGGA